MNYPIEPHPELDDDERYYATASVDEIRRELEHYGVRVEPAIAAVRALIAERTPHVQAAEATYRQQLASIERIAAFTARRSHLTADETAEFIRIVRVRLFENDYAIIRRFEGRSSFTTYLTTVIVRLFHQWRVEQWAKWRPSAEARALGEPAITLERLMSRDGFSFPEAVTILTQRHPQQPEEPVRDGERAIAVRSILAALDRAMAGYSPEDRLFLQLRFRDKQTVPEIARILGLEPKKVYSRLEHLFKVLRRALEDAGIDQEDVGEVMDQRALDLSAEPRPEQTYTPRGRKDGGSNGAGR